MCHITLQIIYNTRPFHIKPHDQTVCIVFQHHNKRLIANMLRQKRNPAKTSGNMSCTRAHGMAAVIWHSPARMLYPALGKAKCSSHGTEALLALTFVSCTYLLWRSVQGVSARLQLLFCPVVWWFALVLACAIRCLQCFVLH